MKTRIITAIIAAAGIVPFFWFSAPVEPKDPLNYLFPFLFAAISFVSVWEMLHCLKLDKTYAISVPLYVLAFAFPMLARVMYGDLGEYVRLALLVSLVVDVYLFGFIVFKFGRVESGKIATLFMTTFYIIGANSAVIVLRDMENGRFLFLIPFILSWTTDSSAYFTGRLFGKHKLIESVSPKKTVEGAIGGFVFCALAAMLYGLIVGHFFEARPNYLVLAVGGLLIGVVAQIGDLVMSAIKRENGLKDYGWMLPGHGGLLDRFDSSMAVTVLLVVIAHFFPIFY